MSPMSASVWSRRTASPHDEAWTVDSDPSWPVVMAVSRSTASPPRHSPTTIRSGRMRSAFRTSARMGMAPRPSMLGGRLSSRTTWGIGRRSSAASSMVTIRSSSGMNDAMAASVVVLPLPVPPVTRMFRRATTAPRRSRSMRASSVPSRTSSSPSSTREPNRRMVSVGPSRLRGGMIALTREPSGSLASTMGLASSTRRPRGARTRSMTCTRWASSSKTTGVRVMRPSRST